MLPEKLKLCQLRVPTRDGRIGCNSLKQDWSQNSLRYKHSHFILHRLFLFCFSPIAAEHSSHRKPHSLSLRITFPPCILLVLYNSECYSLLKTQSNIHFSPLYSLLPILHILRSPMCILYVLHFFSFLPSSIPSAYSSFILFDFLLSLFSSFIISFPFLLSILYIPLHLPCSFLS